MRRAGEKAACWSNLCTCLQYLPKIYSLILCLVCCLGFFSPQTSRKTSCIDDLYTWEYYLLFPPEITPMPSCCPPSLFHHLIDPWSAAVCYLDIVWCELQQLKLILHRLCTDTAEDLFLSSLPSIIIVLLYSFQADKAPDVCRLYRRWTSCRMGGGVRPCRGSVLCGPQHQWV